ncbi:hypothetical protein PMAC_002137 [Pneumocystis sp. 'macacae']|nr:hypothetical protein PMAC_002137 [Pneumocystis sp. 'macacae']
MKNKVGSRRGSQERDKEVYTRHRGRVGEVGCEKNVYRGNKMVCTKQLGGGGRGEGEGRGRRGVEVGVQRVEGVRVEMESRSNKIEEVEVEVEIRFRLALRGVGEGYIRGGEVDGVHQVSEMSVCTRVGRRGAPGGVVEEGDKRRWGGETRDGE